MRGAILIAHGYSELAVGAEHVLAIESLPPIHKDPFGRLLPAHARTEGMILLTVDASVSQYKESLLTV